MSIIDLKDIQKTSAITADFSSGSAILSESGFHRPVWFGMLARHCFADQPCLFPSVESQGARVTLPLIDQGDRYASLANYYSFSYGPILEGAATENLQYVLLKQIAERLRGQRSRISLSPLFEETGLADRLRRAFADAGWIATLTEQGHNPLIRLNGRDFNGYWAMRPAAFRASLNRKARLAPYFFSVHNHLNERLWRDYNEVHASSGKNTEPYPDMVRAIADEAYRRNALRIGLARADNRIVAAQIWTIEGDCACIHKMACDVSHDRQSPGDLLTLRMISYMIDEEKVREINHGTGNSSRKKGWMELERPVLRLDCFEPTKWTGINNKAHPPLTQPPA